MAREDFAPAPDSGGGGSYVMEIHDAYFGISPQYTAKSGRQTLFLHWVGSTDRESQPLMDRDGYHPSFSCGLYRGDDWDTVDGGKTATHPTGSLKFGAQSRIQELFQRVSELIPAGHPDDPLENYRANEAEAWVGLKFKIDRVEKEVNVPDDTGPGRVTRKVEYDMPVEFLGKVDVAAAAPPVAASAPGPVAAAGGSDDVMRLRLVAVAKASDTIEGFQANALKIEGISPGLMGEVFDDSPTGLFAQAKL